MQQRERADRVCASRLVFMWLLQSSYEICEKSEKQTDPDKWSPVFVAGSVATQFSYSFVLPALYQTTLQYIHIIFNLTSQGSVDHVNDAYDLFPGVNIDL